MEIAINNAELMPSKIFDDFNTIHKEFLFKYATKIDIDCYNELLKITDFLESIKRNGIDVDKEKKDRLGRPVESQEGLQTLRECKSCLENYQEFIKKKMDYYLKELSK